MRAPIIIGIIFLGFSANAQIENNWKLYKPQQSDTTTAAKVEGNGSFERHPHEGRVKFYQDSRITQLDSVKNDNPTKMDGYRVQLFFGDKEKASAMRADFLRKYPETGAYISYLAPNFRLRVGDFRNKLESEKFKKELDPVYTGSYIVLDKINLPKIKE